MTTSLSARTVRGLSWVYSATALTALLQVGFTAVLSRLLAPSEFGVVAMAMIVLRFGNLFTQLGLGQALVQRLEIDRMHERVSFTVSLLLGIGGTAVCWLVAPLVARFFGDQDVQPVLRALGLSFTLSGLAVTALALLRRRLLFKRIAITDVTAYVIAYLLVGVPLAVAGAGPWSLVGAFLMQSALTALLAYAFTRHTLRLSLDRSAFGALAGFGSKVSAIGILEFFGTNLDTVVVGRSLGPAALGVYTRAFNLITAPMQLLASSSSRVFFPSASKLQRELGRLGTVYAETITVFAVLAMPIGWGVAAAARDVVLVILGERWLEAVPPLRLLATAAPIGLLSHLAGVACEVTATLRIKVVIAGAHVGLVAVLYTVLRRYGIVGIAAGFLVGDVAVHVAYAAVTKRLFTFRLGDLVRMYRPGVVAGITAFVLVGTAAVASTRLAIPPYAALLSEVAVGGLVLASCVLRAGRGAVWWSLDRRIRTLEPGPRLQRMLGFFEGLAACPDSSGRRRT